MKTIYAENNELTKDEKFTYLSADADAADGTLTVQSIVGFAINKILCIGEIGSEKTEIVKTHAATAPSGSTITLASNLSFAHPEGTTVYIVDWDQAEFSHAATTDGTKTVMTTTSLQVDHEYTQYEDTTYSSGYYFYRLKNSILNVYSTYSDPLPYGDYGDNTVMAIKQRALEAADEKIGDLITHKFLDECLWQARREYHNSPGKRPFRRDYESDLGNVTTGMYSLAVPSDLQDPETAQNIFSLRVGIETPMKYYTKREWNEDYQGVGHTTVSSAITAGDTSIALTNTRDFDESGTITIGTQDITYTANNESTGILTGVPASGDGAVETDIDADTDVWQNASFGLPKNYTVFENYIYFNCPIHNDYVDQNIWGDYYKTVVEKDSDADELDEPEYDMYVSYLTWRIKKKKDPSLKAENDTDYKEWLVKKANALNNEYLGQDIHFIPDIEHLE